MTSALCLFTFAYAVPPAPNPLILSCSIPIPSTFQAPAHFLPFHKPFSNHNHKKATFFFSSLTFWIPRAKPSLSSPIRSVSLVRKEKDAVADHLMFPLTPGTCFWFVVGAPYLETDGVNPASRCKDPKPLSTGLSWRTWWKSFLGLPPRDAALVGWVNSVLIISYSDSDHWEVRCKHISSTLTLIDFHPVFHLHNWNQMVKKQRHWETHWGYYCYLSYFLMQTSTFF